MNDKAVWALVEFFGDHATDEQWDDLLGRHGIGQPSDWGDFKAPLFCTECMVDYPCPPVAALAERLGWAPPNAADA